MLEQAKQRSSQLQETAVLPGILEVLLEADSHIAIQVHPACDGAQRRIAGEVHLGDHRELPLRLHVESAQSLPVGPLHMVCLIVAMRP